VPEIDKVKRRGSARSGVDGPEHAGSPPDGTIERGGSPLSGCLWGRRRTLIDALTHFERHALVQDFLGESRDAGRNGPTVGQAAPALNEDEPVTTADETSPHDGDRGHPSPST